MKLKPDVQDVKKVNLDRNPVSWKKMKPLRMLCVRRSHAGERSRDPRKPPPNRNGGLFLQVRYSAFKARMDT